MQHEIISENVKLGQLTQYNDYKCKCSNILRTTKEKN